MTAARLLAKAPLDDYLENPKLAAVALGLYYWWAAPLIAAAVHMGSVGIGSQADGLIRRRTVCAVDLSDAGSRRHRPAFHDGSRRPGALRAGCRMAP